jgi:hypothetical protein
VHDEDRPGAGADRFAQARFIEVPGAVVAQRVGREGDALERGEKIEQRVARPRDQELVAGVGQQLEEEAVGFAGRGGQKQALGVDGEAAPAVVVSDGGACFGEAARGRRVGEGARIGEGGGERGRVVEIGGGRVALGEIEELLTTCPALVDGAGDPILLGAPVETARERRRLVSAQIEPSGIGTTLVGVALAPLRK